MHLELARSELDTFCIKRCELYYVIHFRYLF